jgi:acetyl-CoA acyltransferase 2
MSAFKNVYIVAAKRTPFGKFGGKLKDLSATDLAVITNRAALEQAKLSPEKVDTVIVGNIIHTSTDAIYLARHSALKVGVPVHVPALTVNRLCGSGFQSIVSGAQEILLGEARVALCAGAESMSLAPFVTRDVRFGVRFGTDAKLEDALWAGLSDSFCKLPMGMTAENLAEQYKITRAEVDAFALQSQHRWQAAQDGGRFAEELAPVTLKGRKGDEVFAVDEHPRGKKSTPEELAKLSPVFKKGGTVTAGNASGVCDGAGSVILASEEAVKEYNLTPLARFAGYHVSGCDPKIMGIGMVYFHTVKSHL